MLHKPSRLVSACARVEGKKRAASLIELLVVVSLIGLLLSLLIPSLTRSMRVASSTVCMNNLRELGRGLAYYRYDNEGWLPIIEPQDPVAGSDESSVWFMRLFPQYLPDLMALTCPDDPYSFRLRNTSIEPNDPAIGDYSSYGVNGFIMTGGGSFLGNVERHRPSRPLDTILAADIGPDFSASPSGGGVAETRGPTRNAGLLRIDDGYEPFAQAPSAPWLTARHHGSINVLTIEGGVRQARTVDIMQNPIRRFYRDCAAGGCTICTELGLYHYSFARDRLYWWTGPAPSE